MYASNRQEMINTQIIKRGIKNKRVLKAMSNIPRELFVPNTLEKHAYDDSPLPIGYGQIISQPFVTALMVEEAMIKPDSKILEIGTGSGYLAAVLSQLCKKVYSIEVIKLLGERAKKLLKNLNYNNVSVLIGDGYNGLNIAAPFDVIIITATLENISQTLISQLKIGGMMIAPVGSLSQELMCITKTENGFLPVKFLPIARSYRVKL
jgi:protein-L-isoaspartate(D-aspartate) O-methyltransferase